MSIIIPQDFPERFSFEIGFSNKDILFTRLFLKFNFWKSISNCGCHPHMSRNMTKPTKWVCAPQRRLRSAWASAQSDQSSLSAWRNLGPLATHWAHSENSDQTGWSEGQADPSLCWVHTHFVGFVMRWPQSEPKSEFIFSVLWKSWCLQTASQGIIFVVEFYSPPRLCCSLQAKSIR